MSKIAPCLWFDDRAELGEAVEGGETVQCGWLRDRFDVSWQIVPTALGEMLRGADPARTGRVMRALMQMIKLDIAGLRKAYKGGAVGNT